MTSHSTPLLHQALADRYSVLRELGRGGMATVYLASDLKLQRPVALKVLRPELAASLGTARFLREIAIAARLSHPHILALHDSGEAGGHLYYAMPYVEGESLRDKLEREGQLPVAEVITILQAVASALTYAHQAGVVHRDIKPENILLSRNSEGPLHPLVADFGIARALDVAGGERLTETGLALGTPAYMSPEQAAAGRLDGRSDIYALGCVAYEMLAGTPPFTGPTAQAILARHAVDPPPPLHTVRRTVSDGIEWAVERALAKVPADRFATADEFARALVEDGTPRRARRRPRRRWIKPILAAGAGVLALAAGTMMLRSSSVPRVTPSATTVAVLPFLSASRDSVLTRLGRDLAVTISATLDGVGEVKSADRLTIANATADQQNMSPAEGAALARRLGAGSFLRGTLVRAGDNIRLDAGLYDVKGMAPIAAGITVGGHRDSLAALTDSVVWSLLRQVWQRGEPPSPSLTAITTRSLPALRSFLEGERQLGDNHWDQAALAFRSAMAADSGFSLAYFRYALTQWWTQQPLDSTLLLALRSHGHLLLERERMLVDAFLTSERTPRLRIEQYRAAAERFPAYWPAWFLYADALYHQGPIIGYEWTDALDAFRRVIAMNPKLVPAWEHVFELTVGRDPQQNATAFATLVREGWLAASPPGGQLVSKMLAGVTRGGDAWSLEGSRVADSLARFICCGVRAEPPDLADHLALEYEPLFLLQAGYPAAQIDLNRRALSTGKVPTRVATALRVANAWAWAARGQWDSALNDMSRLAATASKVPLVPSPAFQDYGMAVVGSVIGATPPAEADRRRARAAEHISRAPDERSRQFGGAYLAWLDGLLGFARNDRGAIRRARAELARTAWYQVPLADRSLAALDQALTGDRRGAGRKLAELEEYCIVHEDCNSFLPHIAVQRFLAAQWLQESGELEQAARLLRWQEAAWQGWGVTFRDALDAPAYLLRARIEEVRADTARARYYFEQFLRRYDLPMPSQAHLVTEAKAALARLEGDR